MAAPTLKMLSALDRIIADPGAPLPDGLGPLAGLCAALAQGPEPRESLLRLRALLKAAGEEAAAWPLTGEGVRSLASVLSAGPDLGRMLARDPTRVGLLLDAALGRPWSVEELGEALDHHVANAAPPGDLDALALALTRFRNDQVLRLAACEFAGIPLEQVGLELSHVADLCLDRAMAGAAAALEPRHGPAPCRVTAIALGKHGARELNFCSDIDVIYIYEADGGRAGDLTAHEYFTRVCQRASRLLTEPNEEGLCFRVDLRLRPEGKQGPLCNALAGAERYYETWGGPWDRLAWLRARPAAGDLDLGREAVEMMRPFVFPRAIRPEIVEQLQELNRRIQARPQGGGGSGGGWNVKLDAGGIREVEFFAQSLQLLHAGKLPELQQGATLHALDRLVFCGLISEQEQRGLAEAYQLWRRIEHRLQLYAGRQTHTLPDGGPLRRWLVAHLGPMPAPDFDHEISRRRGQVSAIYATLSAEDEEPPPSPLIALLDPELPPPEAERMLGDAGFTQPAQAARLITRLADKPWGPLGRSPSAVEARLAPRLLRELANSPDPDAALHHYSELSLRVGPYRGLWQMLEENPPTLRLLLSLFGTSDFLARLFISHPELLDKLLLSGRALPLLSPGELDRELTHRLASLDPDDEEGQLNELRRVRNEQVLRVGLHDIAGELELEEVWAQLSALAQAILARIYPLCLASAARRYGLPRLPDGRQAGMSILALGKLGGRELTYASDLDLVFVHSGGGPTDGRRQVGADEFFARVAQRVISALTSTMEAGQLYEVDTRLRPSGNQGTLVSSLQSFQTYHQEAAQVWERQVLLKARPVAGDEELGQELDAWVKGWVHGGEHEQADIPQEVRRLRGRLEQEKGGGRPGFFNLKLGAGGLLDVEFVVQYLQLRDGASLPGVRLTSTLGALSALCQEGSIQRNQAQRLERGYRFLRRLEARLRVVRDRSAEHLPDNAAGLEVMARRLTYRGTDALTAGEQLLADYERHTSEIREIFIRVLGGPPGPSEGQRR